MIPVPCRWRLTITVWFAFFNVLVVNATVDECKAYTKLLHRRIDPELSNVTQAMWKQYASICEDEKMCVFETAPVSAVTRLNFGGLKETPEFVKLHKTCREMGTDESPSTLCFVNSHLSVNNGATGSGLVTDEFYSRREPVCFPYECAERQVEMVHANPLGCDPEKTHCVIDELEAVCGDRPIGSGVGNCHKYSMEFNGNQTYIDAVNSLNTEASMACIALEPKGGIDGDSDPVCTSTTKPIRVQLGQDFRKFESDDTYQTFLDHCFEDRAQVCYMSMSVKMKGEVGFFNLDLIGDYNDYPMCFPSECQEMDKKTITKKVIADHIGGQVQKAMSQGMRRLNVHPQRQMEIMDRVAQADVECPAQGMTTCDLIVTDFFCIEKGDTDSTPLTMGSPSSHIYIHKTVSLALLVAFVSAFILSTLP